MSSMKALFDFPYFLHNMKRNRGFIIFFSIAFFVAGPLLLAFVASLSSEIAVYAESARAELLIIVHYIGIALDFASMAAGFAMACSVCRRWYDKNSTYFYNSLPVKRSAMFITDVASSAVSYLFCLVLDGLLFAVVALISIAKLPVGFALGQLFIHIGEALLYFLIMYAFIRFAGQLCASSFGQVLLGSTFVFIGYIDHAIALSVIETFDSSFKADYFTKISLSLSPVTSLFSSRLDPDADDVSSMFIWFAVAVILTVLAGILFCKRKSEVAGDTLSATWVRYPVRVIYTVPATMSGTAIFFLASSGSFIWTAIGFILGALLTHMIVNGIVFRNVSKLLYGIVSFGTICAACLLCVLALANNWLGINNMPKKEAVKSIEVSGSDFFSSFRPYVAGQNDKDLLYDYVASCDILNEGKSKVDYYTDIYDSKTRNITVIYHTRTGTVAKKYIISATDESDRLLSEIKKRESYLAALFDFKFGGFQKIDRNNAEISVLSTTGSFKPLSADRLEATLMADISTVAVNGNDYETKYAGCYSITVGSGSRQVWVDVHHDMVNTLAYLEECGYTLHTKDFTDTVDSVQFYISDGLYNTRTVNKGDGDFDKITEFLYGLFLESTDNTPDVTENKGYIHAVFTANKNSYEREFPYYSKDADMIPILYNVGE